jgi:hypothetical protein
VVIGLAAVTTLAYADDQQSRDLARLSLTYGRKRIAGSEFSAIKSLLTATKEEYPQADRLAGLLIAYAYGRERAAIASAAVFARTPESRNAVERLTSLLDKDEAASRAKIDEIAAIRARELNVTRTAGPRTEAEQRAARLIPVRNKGKELVSVTYVTRTLAKDVATQVPKIEAALDEVMRHLRARGESELRLMGLRDAPAYCVDGKRSILEIRDAIAVEYAPIAVEVLELYFRAFEKAGVMRIMEK